MIKLANIEQNHCEMAAENRFCLDIFLLYFRRNLNGDFRNAKTVSPTAKVTACQGSSFFSGFLGPISRDREIENDAFHGLILQFHGHFTGLFLNFMGFSSNQTQTEQRVLWKAGPRQTPERMLACDLPGQYY